MLISVAKRGPSSATKSANSDLATVANNEDPYPVDTGPSLAHLLRQYKGKSEPIVVSFRKLVHWLKVGERLTHYIHPYPGKLLPHIPHFFLASTLLVGHQDAVLDPFAGTGTVALETILSGRSALYTDINPLARLISMAKTRPIQDEVIESAARHVRRRFQSSRVQTAPDVVNLEKWFDDGVIRKLLRIRSSLDSLENPVIRDLMSVTFSAVVRKVSNADPRFSVPVRRPEEKASSPRDVWQLFETQLRDNRARLKSLYSCSTLGTASPAGRDARHLRTTDDSAPLPDDAVGMVLTSPPYCGAQKYVRATSLSLGWLGLAASDGLRPLEDLTIGREHYPKTSIGNREKSGIPAADKLIELIAQTNPTRATIAATYLSEMHLALREAVRVLRPGGHFVLVIGDNTVCGHSFKSSDYLKQMLEQMGLVTILWLIDPIRSRCLITRRATTANVILHESIIVLRKSALNR